MVDNGWFVTPLNTNHTDFVRNVSQYTLERDREKKDITTALKRQLKTVVNPASTMMCAAETYKGVIMKLCKDCKHSLEDNWRWECHYPKNLETDYSTGETKTRWTPMTLRKPGWFEARFFNTCGREARWFEPKYKPARERPL